MLDLELQTDTDIYISRTRELWLVCKSHLELNDKLPFVVRIPVNGHAFILNKFYVVVLDNFTC